MFFLIFLLVKSSRLRKPYVSTLFHAVLIWVLISTTRLKRKIAGGFKCFLFSPRSLGKNGPNLTSIFFRWVGSTTNQEQVWAKDERTSRGVLSSEFTGCNCPRPDTWRTHSWRGLGIFWPPRFHDSPQNWGVRKPCKSAELRVTGPNSGQIRCSSNLFVAKKLGRLPLIFESSSFTSLDFLNFWMPNLCFLNKNTSIFDLRFESKRDELQKKINTLLDAWTSSGRDLRLRWRQLFLGYPLRSLASCLDHPHVHSFRYMISYNVAYCMAICV